MKIHFIVGTGRCGSSFIHEILAHHESIGFVSNVDDNLPHLDLKGRFNNILYRATGGNWTRKGRLRIAPSEAYQLISRKVSPIYANSARDLTADDVTPWLHKRVEKFFGERFEIQGKPFFVHKYTGWPRMDFFASIFPGAKFINVIRDGRAVANSLLQMDWWTGYLGPDHWHFGPLPEPYRAEWEASHQSHVVLAGIAWKILMDAFARTALNLGRERYLEIRYEDFLEHPEKSLRHMLDFLQIPWSMNLEKALRSQRIDVSRRRAFDTDLSAEQLTQLQACLAPALQKYGYA